MVPSSLYIVRGPQSGHGANTHDPVFSCMAHSTKSDRYLALEISEDGISRQIVDGSAVTSISQNFRGTVHLDVRNDAGLMPLPSVGECVPIDDFSTFRRAKSDAEIADLDVMYADTRSRLDDDFVQCIDTFRGNETSMESGFTKTEHNNFVQYRGGFRDRLGRSSDLTTVVPKTQEWEDRLDRVYQGLEAVEKHAGIGVSRSTLNNLFLSHMDPQDSVYGNVTNAVGWSLGEDGMEFDTLNKYDYIMFGCAIAGPDDETPALVFRNARAIVTDAEIELDSTKDDLVKNTMNVDDNDFDFTHS